MTASRWCGTGLTRSIVVVSLIAVGVALARPAAALAQAESPSPAPSDAPAPATDSGLIVAIALIVAGAFALLLLFAYLAAWRTATTRMMERSFDQTGMFPSVEHVGPGVPGDGLARAEAGPVISGPKVVLIGRPSDPFTVAVDGTRRDADWTVEGDALIEPARGPEARVTATAEGSLTVTATVDGANAVAEVQAIAMVLPAAPSPGRIPLVAEGYGAFTVTVLAIVVAGSLTAIGLLPGAALATLLGTLVAYFFVQRGRGAEGDNPPP